MHIVLKNADCVLYHHIFDKSPARANLLWELGDILQLSATNNMPNEIVTSDTMHLK